MKTYFITGGAGSSGSPLADPQEDGDAPPPRWLRQRIIERSLWLVALRWILRALSLVRTIVLARVLTPADFGIFGMAMLVARVVETPTALDLDLALIRRADAGRREFDSAWTLRGLNRLLVGIVLLLGAPLAGAYFNEPRVVPVVRVVALGGAVWLFENIGIVTFRKELNFAKEFVMQAVTTLASLSVTIVAALLLRSYWALIIGFVVERCVWTLATYVVHPYRPRIGWAAARELWSFAQWVPLQNTGRLLKNTLDSFLIGRVFGAPQLGIYTMGNSAAGLTNAEVVAPVTSALFPSYAKLAHDPERLARAYVDALGMIALLLSASAVGMAVIAPTFVPVMLGPQWLAAVPVAQLLSLYVAVNGLSASVANVLMVLGRMRRLTATIYVQLVIYAPVLLLVAWRGGLVEMAAAKATLALLLAPGLFAALTGVSAVTPAQILGVLWRPALSSLLMVGTVTFVQRSWSSISVAALAAQIAAGGAAFTLATVGLWIATGRPAGAERTLIEWAAGRLAARHARREFPPFP